VVSSDHIDSDARLPELRHSLRKEKPCIKVRPISVIEISGDDDEINPLPESALNHVLERAPGRAPYLLHGRTLIALQATQRTVEVDIRAMKKPHALQIPESIHELPQLHLP